MILLSALKLNGVKSILTETILKFLAFREDIKFERISSEQGLSQSVVNCIIQDHIGFMWFGTQDGLNLYDGNKFTIYRNDIEDPFSIANNFIRCIYEDRMKNLWVGTVQGLSRYDRDLNRFNNYFADPKAKDGFFADDVRSITEDAKGNVLVASYNGGISRYFHSEDRFVNCCYYKSDHGKPEFRNRINAMLTDKKGNVWVGTWGDGLYKFDLTANALVVPHKTEDKTRDINLNRINCLTELPDGRIAVATNNGFYVFDQKGSSENFFSGDPENDASLILVSVVMQDSRKNLWVGTRENGIIYFDRENDKHFNLKFEKDIASGLSSDVIMCIYEDRSGVIWIGTFGGGLSKLRRSQKKIRNYRTDSDDDELGTNNIYCFCEDSNGDIWVGTGDRGYCRLDRKNNTFHRLEKHRGDSNASNTVTSIIEDENKNLWIGSTGGGIEIVNIHTGAVTRYSLESHVSLGLNHDTIYSIAKEKPWIFWIGTGGGGANVIDTRTGKVRIFMNSSDPDSISSNKIRIIFTDRKGNVWLGTDDAGLNLYDAKKGRFIHFKFDPADSSSISGNYIISIFEDSKGNIWIGTMDRGFNKLDRRTGKFKRYTVKDGLANSCVNAMLEDNSGKLWISTNNGISRFDPLTEEFRNYDAMDGFQGNEFNQSAALKLKSGEMVFGGIDGFSIFFPEKIRDSTYVPPVVLTDFSIFNKSMRPGVKDSPISKSIWIEDSIHLSHRQSVFSFEIASLDYNIPEKNQYCYRMEGFDHDWVMSGNRRFVTYTNLDPGDYTFKVKATNSDGIWNNEGVGIKLKIDPPFWKTWWFKCFGTIAAAGAAGSIYKSKLDKVLREQKAQEEFTKRLIEVQENDRKRIAGDLHDNIGQHLLITKNKLLMSAKRPDDREHVLKNVTEATDIITETLKDVREISYSIHPYQIERLGFSKAIKSIADRAEKSTGIKFIAAIDDIDNLLPPDIEINLYRIIQECINNVIKHSEAEETILNLNRGAGDISILISDNGKGFDPENLKAKNVKQGFGLTGIEERVRLIKGKLEIQSSSSGTSVKIVIKQNS